MNYVPVRPKKRKLTSRQRVLAAIRQFHRAYHYPPTMRELMHKLDFNTVEAIRYHLKVLRETGVIEWTEGPSRSIRLISDKEQTK